MADRSIVVRLRAQVDGFKREMAEATKAVEQTAKGTEDSAKRADTAMGRMVQSAKDNQQAWNTAGATLTGFGAAALGGLALATKAAMDWESAWAGVQKTVDGTAPQMAALEQGLRGMARELPATHQEIAAVAEAAGQLGIATPNILGFTRTMIDMGEATNLSADEAATALARFITVTGTSQSEIGRLGAAVVGLGNNFATTEGEIVALSQRLAAAGTQAGLSEGEIMGLATAMSQVGIEAEAGGSAMTQSMNRMAKAVEEGGDSLDLFAAVSGMTAEQFTTAWETEPAQALIAFTEGLADTSALGMSTNAVLTELGITGLREADTMRRLALATGTMSDAMAMGNEEFEKGTALIDEAAQRYETAESRIAMARNTLVDAGISVGAVVLPAFAGLADGVADVAGWFADLPAPVHATVAGLAGVAGAASLGAGSFLLLAPRVLDTVSAFRDLGAISPRTATRVGRVTLAVGKVGLGLGVAAAVFPAFVSGANSAADAIEGINRQALDLGMNELTTGLLEAERSGDAFNAILGDLYESGAVTTDVVGDLGEAVQKVAFLETGGGIEGWFAQVGNAAGMTRRDLQSLQDRFEGTGDALVVLAQTDLPRAQKAFAAFMTAAEAGGATFEQVMSIFPGFKDEVVGLAEAMGLDATDSAVLYKVAMGELSPVVDDTTGAVAGYSEAVGDAADETQSAADAADELFESMLALANGFIDSERAAMAYEDAISEASEAAEKNGKHWEDGTEAAEANKNAILDLAEAAWRNAEAMEKNGESSGEFLQDAREGLVDVLEQMTGNRELAEEYVDQLGLIPEEIQSKIEFDIDAAKEQWTALWEELGYNPPEIPVGADTDPARESVTEFEGFVMDGAPPEVPIDADTTAAEEEVHVFGSRVGDVPTDPVIIDADSYFGEEQLRSFQRAVNETGGTVEINGETVYADSALNTLVEEINQSGGTVMINGTPVTAEASLLQLIDIINASGGVVEIDGDNVPANMKIDATKQKAGNTTGTINVDANTSAANRELNNLARRRTAVIDVSVTGNTSALRGSSMGRSMRAAGGPVFGPGTGTSDSIPAMLSNNEHVLTAAEVALAGGHDSVYRMRAAIRAGALRFAEGGGIDGHRYAQVPALPVSYLPQRSSTDSQPMGGWSGPPVQIQAIGLDATAVAAETGAVFEHKARVMSVGYHR